LTYYFKYAILDSMKNMNKINITNSVLFALGILAILAIVLIALPHQAAADTRVYCDAYSNGIPTYSANVELSAKPSINSISPSMGKTARTIRITGASFIPNSVALIDGQTRRTVFIDSTHLLVETRLGDLANEDGFYVSVFNEGICGGYSNAEFFSTNPGGTMETNTTTNTTVNNNYSNTTYDKNTTKTTETKEGNYVSNLASNAIFGSNSFLPTGLVGWIMTAIVIMLIIILVRKIFGAEQTYHEAPMKHD